MEPRTILGPSTLIPISAIVVIVGFVFWLTSVFLLAETNAKGIADIKHQVEARLWDANERLARIEGKLDVLVEKLADQTQTK